MVRWSTVAYVSLALYLIPIKHIIKSLIDYYKNKPRVLKLSKTVIVVLDKIGMNYERAKEYAKHHCKIVLVGKSKDKGEKATKELTRLIKNKNISWLYLNTSSKEKLKDFAKSISEKVDCIDVIVNNDGFEITDMELNFKKQELALERFENHCIEFLNVKIED